MEAHRRGELTKEEYETKKAELKKQLPVATFHATFKNGKRKNEDAIPSGMSIYDLDHIANPRAKWAEIEARKEELGILLAHISPSLEGLRLVFLMQQGMSLAEAQAWMAQHLGDKEYDSCVKDYARCSFIVPREYVLWLDEEGLFSLNSPQSTQSFTEDSYSASDDSLQACHPERSEGSVGIKVNTSTGASVKSVVKEEEKENSVELRVLRGENQYPANLRRHPLR